MSNNYWTSTDNGLVQEFYYCYTGITSGSTRNKIFNLLQPKFNYLINQAIQSRINSWCVEDKEEVRQDCLLRIWNVLSNNLDISKFQGVLNFLWVVTNNNICTLTRRHNLITKPKIIYDSDILNCYSDSTDEDNIIDYNQVRKDIIIELDNKIKEQEKLNRVNTIYLTLLRAYLIEHNFSGKGFQKYICEKLNINRANFYQINFKLKIRTQVFNDKEKKYK